MDNSPALKFGHFELQARQRLLLHDGEPVILGARAFDLLLALVERRDRLVTKAELLDLVWPGLVVEENNLQVQVSTLRRLLGAQVIATIPGCGYRFTATLTGEEEAARSRDADDATPSAAAGVIDLSLPHKPSIAVLPFANLSGDPEQKFFADGVVEEIITALSRVRALFVIARNSCFAYEGKAVDIRRVGRELGVRYVLEGSVRRAANRVRITAQLIDASAGTHLWSEKYDHDLTDLFALQDEITRDIVGVVAPQVLDAEIQRVRRKDPQSLDAWEAAVRAQWHLAQLNREDNAEALRWATKSVELNPGDTAGFNVAAHAHIYDAVFGWSASAGQSFMAANEVARKAVTLDPRDEMSQTAMGSSELFLGQHDSAMARLRAAVALNPSFSWAHGNLGLSLALAGNAEEGVASLKEALRLSPIDKFSLLWIYLLGFASFLLGRNEEALDFAERSLRERASFPGPYRIRAACLAQLGRTDEARKSIDQYLRLAPNATIKNLRSQVPLRRDADYERYANALRQAGMPE